MAAYWTVTVRGNLLSDEKFSSKSNCLKYCKKSKLKDFKIIKVDRIDLVPFFPKGKKIYEGFLFNFEEAHQRDETLARVSDEDLKSLEEGMMNAFKRWLKKTEKETALLEVLEEFSPEAT